MALSFEQPIIESVPAPIARQQFAKRSEAVIEYIQQLIVPSGEGAGEPFKLREWQKKFIRDVYDPIDPETHRRVVRRAILSMGRKNGKTALIAALVLAHLEGPESIVNGEIYSAANDREQASIVYRFAQQMVEGDQRLSEILKVRHATRLMTNRLNGSIYKAITAESGTKHGLNASLVIYDELAQAKSRDLFDVLDTAMGARKEPLFITISTQSHDPEHPLSQIIDDALHAGDPRLVCHLYEVPMDVKDIYNPDCWYLANPALGDFRDLDDLKSIAAKASRLPAEEPKFRNLYLNQRVSPASAFLRRRDWDLCSGPAVFRDGEDVWLSLDLSGTADLTALIMGSADAKTRIKPFMWKPQESIKDHSDRDFGSGNQRYQEWKKQGFLLTTPGRAIDPGVIATRIAELTQQFKVLGLVYDRWGMPALQREFDRIGFQTFEDNEKARGAGLRLIPWGQGYKDMGPAVQALEDAVLNEKLEQPNNPLLNWTIGNAIVTMDPAGARKLDKEKAKFRIDPVVALAMLMGAKARTKAPRVPQVFFAG